jgi:hypothetical protein
MKIVKAIFSKARPQAYSYLVPEGDEPKVGDLIVTSLGGDSQFELGYERETKVATVINVLEENDGKATKFYIHLISREQMKERAKKNAEYKERAEQRAAIKAALDEMLKKQSDMERYSRLASDPVAAELIAKLNELG